jgi:uncharacterized membrane protein YdjX (TVP38/TMEM64 family)
MTNPEESLNDTQPDGPPVSALSNGQDDQGTPNDRWKPVVLIGAIIVILIVSQIFGLAELLGDIEGWIDDLGSWGPVIFILIYIIAVIVTFPASILTIAAGPLFGVFWGVVFVSIASTIGASLSFLIGRYFARDATERWLSSKELFQKLEMLTQEHGAFIVALVRLVPLFPFNMVNYGFGLTKVPFRTYVLWSWICMLPFTIVFVAGTEIAMSLSHGEIPWLLMIVLGITMVILTVIAKHARQLLDEKEKECMEKFGRPDC